MANSVVFVGTEGPGSVTVELRCIQGDIRLVERATVQVGAPATPPPTPPAGTLTIYGLPQCVTVGQSMTLSAQPSGTNITPGSEIYVWTVDTAHLALNADDVAARKSTVRATGISNGAAVVTCAASYIEPAPAPTPQVPNPSPISRHDTGTASTTVSAFGVRINPAYGRVGYLRTLRLQAIVSDAPAPDAVTYSWRVVGSTGGGRGILNEPGRSTLSQGPVLTQAAYFQGLDDGLVTVEVQATSGTCTVLSRANILVGATVAPVVTVTTSNDNPDVGDQITLTATVTANLGQATVDSVTWKAAYEPTAGAVAGTFSATTGESVTWTPATGDDRRVVVFGATVQLSDGRIGTGSLRVPVGDVTPAPTLILRATANPPRVAVGGQTRLTVAVISGLNEATITHVNWSAAYRPVAEAVDGQFSTIGLTETAWRPGTGANNRVVTVSVSVTLSDGRMGETTVDVAVGTATVAPELVFGLVLSNTNPKVGDRVRMTVIVQSGQGTATIASTVWTTNYVPVGGVVDETRTTLSSHELEWVPGALADQRTVSVLAAVTMSDGRSGYATAELTVGRVVGQPDGEVCTPFSVLSAPPVVAMPSGVQILQQDINVGNPGRVTHRSPYTGDEITINRGVGRFFGTATIAPVADEAVALAIEGWLFALAGQDAICELPLHRQTADFLAEVLRVDNVGGHVLTTLNRDVPALRRGHFVRSANRTMQVVTVIAPNQFVLVPAAVLTAGLSYRARGRSG